MLTNESVPMIIHSRTLFYSLDNKKGIYLPSLIRALRVTFIKY